MVAGPVTGHAQTELTDQQLAAQVDSISNEVLKTTGVPSASVAVVRHGRIAYAHAYGVAKLDPRLDAAPTMLYGIGSASSSWRRQCCCWSRKASYR